MELHPQILEKDGKPAFVILPYDEFTALRDALEDALDSLALREAKAASRGKPTYSMDDVKAMFGLTGKAER